MSTRTTAVAEPAGRRLSARERLLAAANELFYAEGVHSVGIDRVIEHAGVAKATLYSTFGSKDELVRAYLEGRHATIKAQLTRELPVRYATARERLIGVFEVRGESIIAPSFRGCAFAAANAEAGEGSAAQQATADYRNWLRTLFRDLAAEAGATDPDALARQLHLLYDGLAATAWLDHDPSVVADTVAAARILVGAAIPG
ncbi:MAG TPA: TetR/AcrR family transcriptional regulator [Streptosporangiaceae bacterium]|jgi:AcrR family transcriptional regulator|nr:TetR/AcrR family transcriptional regulator [Streptosporangiaceae bacterium]